MLEPNQFLEDLRASGIELVSGVPCSLFTSLIDTVIASPRIRYVAAANEGDAVAIVSGAELGGRRGAVLFQNSGLGNAVNPFTSLSETFRIPHLVLCSWRGEPQGAPDEPQHERMGRITPELFELMGIPWEVLPAEPDEVPAALERARIHMDREGLPYALIVRRGTFTKGAPRTELESREPAEEAEPFPEEWPELDVDRVLAAVQRNTGPEDILLTTTGFTGRALYAIEDRPNQLYMVGSMGCVSSLGLGLALARPDRRVVVLDGDGAFLIRMGALATLGYYRPANLLHVLLDNGVHDSTGAQATVARSIDPAGVARACGYPRVERATSLERIEEAVRRPAGELAFLHVRTRPRADRKLPRPTQTPAEIARRMRAHLGRPAPAAG